MSKSVEKHLVSSLSTGIQEGHTTLSRGKREPENAAHLFSTYIVLCFSLSLYFYPEN